MVKTAPSRQQGFSFIELLIVFTVFLLVLLAVYQLFDTGSATYRSGQRKADVQQNVRVALDEMVRQLRMARYIPEDFDPDAATTPSLNNPPGILLGRDNVLVVYGDLDGTCNPSQAPCPASSSRVFLFCRLGATIIRKVRTDPTQASSFTCSGGDVLADNITSLTFTYYDVNNAPIPNPPNAPYSLDNQAASAVPSLATADIPQRQAVRTVVVTLTAQEDIPHQQSQIYTLSSSVRLRNMN
jgi:prepilin-type N-terminal cleavage/methylation domain-containing protein